MAQSDRTEHWYQRNSQFNSECDNTEKGGIVFLGNSITEAFDLTQSFPVDKPINRGISGDHIDGLLQRLDSSVVLIEPSRLYLMIGINDIGRGDEDTLILARYDSLLTRLQKELPETVVFVHSILPTSIKWSNCPREKIIRINKQIKKMTESYRYTWIDLYPLFAGTDNFVLSEYTTDGLHLNETGYDLWRDQLAKTGLK